MVGVSHIIITVLQAKCGKIWIDTLSSDLQPTGVLDKKEEEKKAFCMWPSPKHPRWQ